MLGEANARGLRTGIFSIIRTFPSTLIWIMKISTEAKVCALALSLMEGIGPKRAKKLIEFCGGPEAVFQASKEELNEIPGMHRAALNQLTDPTFLKQAEAELNLALKKNWQVHFYSESAYPWRMRHCEDGPLLLFQKGNCNLNVPRSLAIVGTRNMSDYGRDFIRHFSAELRKFGVHVLSGLAYGVDAQAHRSCLDNDIVNSAVLAHGLDRVYPHHHRNLADDIVQGGGSLLTEFPSGTNPDRENFPKRNRIIAGMSDAVIVVEAARKGGALITADLANGYNRDVFAVPGRFNDERSEGCNLLIKSTRAHLLESTRDLAYIMKWDEQEAAKEKQQLELFQNLSALENQVVEALGRAKKGLLMDALLAELKLTTSELLSLLMALELKSVVETLPGPRYRLRS